MPNNENAQPMQMSTPDPALKRLEKLVGTWSIKGRTLDSQDDNISGRVTIELIPTCTLRGHSKMGKIGHGVKKLRVVLKSLQLVTKGINNGIKRGKDTVRKSFFP